MMQEITNQTVAWLAATGAPNGVLVLTLLTHPAMWSEKANGAVGRAFERFGPGSGDGSGGNGGGA